MLKLKLQYFGHLMQRADSLEKTLMLVKNLPAMWETWVWSPPTPVFWPREFHGLYSPWGHKVSQWATFTFSHSYTTTGKIIPLTIWMFVSKMMSLLCNMLSRFVIAFLPRSKHLLISWLQSTSAVILEPKKRESVTTSTISLLICLEVMGPDAIILVFWMLSFKPAVSLSSLIFIEMLFSSSLLSAIRVVSSAYLRLLIFLLENLIPAYNSSSPPFCMMYSVLS